MSTESFPRGFWWRPAEAVDDAPAEDIISEEFPVPVSGIAANNPSGAAMTTTSQFPVIPDSMYFTDVLNPGDRLVMRFRNPTAGTVVAAFVVQITPTGQ